MPNNYFRFKQFTVQQEKSAMKVCTDSCLFGAWIANLMNNDSGRALDIGAGTGLLSLMVAQKTNYIIDSVELDEPAYNEAGENFRRSPWSERLKNNHLSIQEYQPGITYDLVFSNPPFYEKDLKSDDAKRNMALHNDSLDLNALLKAVNKLLKEDGLFAVLLASRRSKEFESTLSLAELFITKKIMVRPTRDHNVYRCMYIVSKGTGKTEPFVDEIIIRNPDNKYTDDFYQLLKDYYLFEKINKE